MRQPASLRIHCPSWEHVEVFYSKKLRSGRSLSLRLPFKPAVGATLTLALELPNELVVAVDGKVVAAEAVSHRELWVVQLSLIGLTSELIARLEALVADGRGENVLAHRATAVFSEVIDPPQEPGAAEVRIDERELFVELDKELRRLRRCTAPDVLGVSASATATDLRKAYLLLAKKYHPDQFSRYHSAAIQHMAAEVFTVINRGYDRLRRRLVAAGKWDIVGTTMVRERGWMLGIDDIVDGAASLFDPSSLSSDSLFSDVDATTSAPISASPQATDDSDQSRSVLASASAALEAGRPGDAREMLASALKSGERDRGLRALYHVAHGLELVSESKAVEATTQFETALVHDPSCKPARSALARMRGDGTGDRDGLFKRLFSR